MSWEIRQGDCIEVLAQMQEASVDAVVCDPPAGIAFMGKHWDRDRGGRDRWIEWLAEAMAEALRVCKPGAHAFVWALPRTSHWTALALEEAGWEIRDRIAHHFGNGFPKNKDLGEGVGTALKPATEDYWLARKPFSGSTTANFLEHGTGGINVDAGRIGTDDDTKRPPSDTTLGLMNDDGWEPKPVETGGHAAGRWPPNAVLSHLDECEQVGLRVLRGDQRETGNGRRPGGFAAVGAEAGDGESNSPVYGDEKITEWSCQPGCPVAELDAQSGVLQSGVLQSGSRAEGVRSGMGFHGVRNGDGGPADIVDRGGAARFFYQAKTSRAEREAGLDSFEIRTADPYGEHRGRRMEDKSRIDGKPAKQAANHHPTVKPINLMRWLVRLVTPPGGTCLDPFLGSGSTGCAAVLEGFDFIGIEREAEYVAIAEARIAFWAQHEGREVEDVLGLHAASQRKSGEHADRGQISLDEALSEAAA